MPTRILRTIFDLDKVQKGLEKGLWWKKKGLKWEKHIMLLGLQYFITYLYKITH